MTIAESVAVNTSSAGGPPILFFVGPTTTQVPLDKDESCVKSKLTLCDA